MSALVLGIDMMTPLGIASGMPYVAIVLFSLWAEKKSYALASAGAATGLTIAGLFLSPPGHDFLIAVFNRGLTILVIWITAFLILEKHASDEKRRQEVQSAFADLERRVRERTADLVKANARLREHMARIDSQNKELQEFAHIASHDLQEPLRKIQTFGSLLAEKEDRPIDEEFRDYLVRMVKAACRMQELIRALSMYSRIGREPGPRQCMALEPLLREVLDDLADAVKESGAQIRIGKLPVIEADPVQMRQLFRNLIDNALKYNDLRPVIEVDTVSCANGHCRIAVKDNGIGFDTVYAEKIFQPFQRLHKRDEYQGTGMGLTICRKVVERHGGRISATGIPGKGATFVVTLPLKSPSRAGKPATSENPPTRPDGNQAIPGAGCVPDP